MIAIIDKETGSVKEVSRRLTIAIADKLPTDEAVVEIDSDARPDDVPDCYCKVEARHIVRMTAEEAANVDAKLLADRKATGDVGLTEVYASTADLPAPRDGMQLLVVSGGKKSLAVAHGGEWLIYAPTLVVTPAVREIVAER